MRVCYLLFLLIHQDVQHLFQVPGDVRLSDWTVVIYTHTRTHDDHMVQVFQVCVAISELT